MIESETARELLTAIQRVEERLDRLLTSGWRQASTEAADLREEVDLLAEAGLPELAAQVGSVARATDAPSALAAIALAASACQLLRLRLAVSEPPAGWQPIPPPRQRSSTTNDTLVPLARIHLNGEDAWLCAWPARHQAVILEAPPPLPAPPAQEAAPAGLVGRLQRKIRQALDGDHAPASPWLRQQLRGSLRWQGRLPVGRAGDLPLCTLDGAIWVADEGDDAQQHARFLAGLAMENVGHGGMIGWYGVSVLVAELELARAAEYDWIDPSMAAAFATMARPRSLALWVNAHPQTFPLALLEAGANARIVHLVPGLPADQLTTS